MDVFREFGLKAVVVPNLVDLSQFRFRRTQAAAAAPGVHARLFAYYCVDVVVRAFAEVEKAYPERALISLEAATGGGDATVSRRPEACQRSTFSESRHARRSASITTRRTSSSMIAADNMPVSVIEAFGAGTPVVTTSPESMPYLVEHERTGLLSAVGDDRALWRKCGSAAAGTEFAARVAQNAYQESRKYTWEAVRGQWVETYRQLSGQRPSRA